MSELLSLDFMRQALIAAVLVGIAAPLVGVFLVQRRLSLIGDGMGHVALAGVAVGVLTGQAPVLTALVAAVAAAVAIELIRGRGRTSGDIALAVMFYGGIAAGVVIIAKSPSSSPANLTAYLFGAITTADQRDLWVFAGLALVVLRRHLAAAPVAVRGGQRRGVRPRQRAARHRAQHRAGRADRRHRRRVDARRRPAAHQRADDHPQRHRPAARPQLPRLDPVGRGGRRGVQRRRGDRLLLRRDPLGRHDRAAGHRLLRRGRHRHGSRRARHGRTSTGGPSGTTTSTAPSAATLRSPTATTSTTCTTATGTPRTRGTTTSTTRASTPRRPPSHDRHPTNDPPSARAQPPRAPGAPPGSARPWRRSSPRPTSSAPPRSCTPSCAAGGDKVGLATVYRNLQAMAADGEIDMLRTDDGEAVYRACSTGHHHHLVCRDCGRTVEVEGPTVEAWAEQGQRRARVHRRPPHAGDLRHLRRLLALTR